MNCIQLPSPFLPFHSQPKHKLVLKPNKLFWTSGQEPTRLGKHSKNISTRTRAMYITNSLFLGAAAQYKGNISVLLQTGSLMLFVYGIANFVVPYFITKGFDKVSEDPTPTDDVDSDLDDQ